ncbi:uncharacterized protein J7T54_004434 [Emericellopsis cladophorae]|uniref:Uncharacterized protein n=1 Tax=Emericellopsis cladophorae TaxID=2686198 RepID=A0A9Q0BEY8_9HYPO|nr:uncharacterized protein J7T54_004434 [Emericellopsis cladophorae]KAI6783407.1 hypothetical protein J7T54_004434 [Emericellopsis cladophorae]
MPPKKREASSSTATGGSAKRARNATSSGASSSSSVTTAEEPRARGWLDEHSVIIDGSRRTRRETRSTAGEHALLLAERARQKQERRVRIARQNSLRRARSGRMTGGQAPRVRSRSPPQLQPAPHLEPAPQLQRAPHLQKAPPLWQTPNRSMQSPHRTPAQLSGALAIATGSAQAHRGGAQATSPLALQPVQTLRDSPEQSFQRTQNPLPTWRTPAGSAARAPPARTPFLGEHVANNSSFGLPSFDPATPTLGNDSTMVLSSPHPIPDTPANGPSSPPSAETPAAGTLGPASGSGSRSVRGLRGSIRGRPQPNLRRETLERSARGTGTERHSPPSLSRFRPSLAGSFRASQGVNSTPTPMVSSLSSSRAGPASTRTPQADPDMTFGSLFTATTPRVSAGRDWWLGQSSALTPTPANPGQADNLPSSREARASGRSRRSRAPRRTLPRREATRSPGGTVMINGDDDGSTTNSNTDSDEDENEDEDEQTPYAGALSSGGFRNRQQTPGPAPTTEQTDEQRARLAAVEATLNAAEEGTFNFPRTMRHLNSSRLPALQPPRARPVAPAAPSLDGINSILEQIRSSRRPGDRDDEDKAEAEEATLE